MVIQIVIENSIQPLNGNNVCNNQHCYLPICLSFAISLTGLLN